jgi:DNA-binding NtrC family response regulator
VAANRKSRILLVDDDTTALELLSDVLSERGYHADIASTVTEALGKLKARDYQALVTDLKMPERSGMDLLDLAVEAFPELPVIMLTGYATIQNAVAALKKGAYDYIAKPVRVDELVLALQKAINHTTLRIQNRFLREELARRNDFLYHTESAAMASVYETLESVRGVQTTVLLQGESGTGKEVVARYIHATGARAAESFVPINCGAIPESLIESELFGYEKGAFTDAKCRTKGKLEIADGGTVFLDEVDELPAKAQVALLRFLQEPEITPLGSTRRISLNVRVIAATNKDLKQLVRGGRFREDLYYRINVLPIGLPPLRERREDILPLAQWFLARFRTEYASRTRDLSAAASRLLLGHPWPGNIRELRNCIERAVIICREPEIPPATLSLEPEETGGDFSEIGIMPLRDLERRYIDFVLERLGGNRTLTASRLGVSLRGLRYKLHNAKDPN